MTARVSACEVPEGSLLATYGGPQDYRDCFVREVPGEVSLAQYIERFYSSMVFAPERIVLGFVGRAKGWDASADAIRALARGDADRFGAWEVVERRSGLVAEHGERPASRKGDRPPAAMRPAGRVSEEIARRMSCGTRKARSRSQTRWSCVPDQMCWSGRGRG